MQGLSRCNIENPALAILLTETEYAYIIFLYGKSTEVAMNYLDKVKSEVKKAAKESWNAVKKSAKKAEVKGEEIAETGKLRYQIFRLHVRAEDLFGKLGSMVYSASKNPSKNPFLKKEVKGVVEDLKKTEQETGALEKKLKNVGKRTASKK